MTAEVIGGAATGAEPASLVTTPGGIEIAFYAHPRRYYTANGIEVVSVTKVLEVLDKPGLPWWGMRVGAQALDRLLDDGVLYLAIEDGRVGFALHEECEVKINGEWITLPANVILKIKVQAGVGAIDEFTPIFSKYKLSTNHIKDEAADRGTGVHNALEAWAAIGQMPNPDAYNQEEKGYVTGLRSFLDDAVAGGFEPEAVEVSVASVKHGYAGRFDLLARTSQPMTVVTKVYDKWKPKVTTVPPSRLLIDLKTSKHIYETHLLQLEAYEGALVECGYGPTDARAILHVTADGRYEFRRARGRLEDFLAVLATFHALGRTKEALKV